MTEPASHEDIVSILPPDAPAPTDIEYENPTETIPKPELKPGEMFINDMTREQLINAVVNLGQANKQHEETINKYNAWAADMKIIWNSADKVKKRLRQLKGK